MLLMLLACTGREVDYSFPDGLEPLEENTATWPADQAETLSTATGEDADYYWAHARGYIHTDTDAVYPCLREDPVDVDRREVASWTVQDDVEDGYEHSYAITSFVENIIDIEFTDTWRHGSTRDADGSTALIISAWKMTEGNDYMYLKEGSILTEVAGEGVTSLEFAGHLSAALRDAETIETYMLDFYSDLLACVAGEDYPTFE